MHNRPLKNKNDLTWGNPPYSGLQPQPPPATHEWEAQTSNNKVSTWQELMCRGGVYKPLFCPLTWEKYSQYGEGYNNARSDGKSHGVLAKWEDKLLLIYMSILCLNAWDFGGSVQTAMATCMRSSRTSIRLIISPCWGPFSHQCNECDGHYNPMLLYVLLLFLTSLLL